MITDWKATPIYITNFNNLERGFRKLVDWLHSAGMTQIAVIDNASTWEPLLKYYDESNLLVLNRKKNLGQDAFWHLGLSPIQTSRYIVTDPDVVPDANCPKDLVRKMHEVADRYAPIKVGPAIRIDNLPAHYAKKQEMLMSEGKYWDTRTKEGDCWRAAIDTTFAMYEPGWGKWPPAGHVRLDFPYVIEHLPWYEDSSIANDEREFFKAQCIPGISHS